VFSNVEGQCGGSAISEKHHGWSIPLVAAADLGVPLSRTGFISIDQLQESSLTAATIEATDTHKAIHLNLNALTTVRLK